MIGKIAVCTRHPFVRNVLKLATGTGLAQIITIISSPIITRLYDPSLIGELGIFTSFAGILAGVAALTYPIAIVLAPSDHEANGIVRLSIYLGAFSSILACVVLLFLYIYGFYSIESFPYFVYLLPPFMFFSVLAAVASQWLIRKEAFNITAKVAVWLSAIINFTKIAIGTMSPSVLVLVVIGTFSNLLQAGMLFLYGKKRKKENSKIARKHNLRAIAIKYRDFPLMRAPQVFINTISNSLPIILLAYLFDATAAGFFTLVSSVLGMPSTLIGTSISQVFYPRASQEYNAGRSITNLIVKTTWWMSAIGFLPFFLIILFGPYLFGAVFGQEWTRAGAYAQWLAPWFFFNYINKPVVWAVPILGVQGGLLVYEVVSVAIRLIGLLFGYVFFKNDLSAIAVFSAIGVLAYVVLILWVVRASRYRSERSSDVYQASR